LIPTDSERVRKPTEYQIHFWHFAGTTLIPVCSVVGITVLHDGINLMAKEFLAARRDERGVLILR
jgi:trehalose-6-phosphate synthase